MTEGPEVQPTEDHDAEDEQSYVQATVVSILNDRELIIDAGPEDGVELGMRFAILGEVVIESKRAENGKLRVPYKKKLVKVVRFVDDFHSVGRTFKVIPGRPGAPSPLTTLSSFRALEGTPATPDRVETLDVDGFASTAMSKVSEQDKKVKPGDTAEQTWGDEYEV